MPIDYPTNGTWGYRVSYPLMVVALTVLTVAIVVVGLACALVRR
jgi:hypothetical protein